MAHSWEIARHDPFRFQPPARMHTSKAPPPADMLGMWPVEGLRGLSVEVFEFCAAHVALRAVLSGEAVC